jgi:hypothetical protein
MGTSYDPTTYLNQQATTAPFVSREASAAERLRSSRVTVHLPGQLSRQISLVRDPRLSGISNWSLLVGLTSALRGELFHITLLKYLDLGCFVFCMKDFAISSRVALLNHKHCGAERRSLAEIWTPSDPDRNVFASERVSGERR